MIQMRTGTWRSQTRYSNVDASRPRVLRPFTASAVVRVVLSDEECFLNPHKSTLCLLLFALQRSSKYMEDRVDEFHDAKISVSVQLVTAAGCG